MLAIRMSACLQLREPGIARVRRWCLQPRFPGIPSRVEFDAARGSWRPPGAGRPGAGALAASGRGSRAPWLRYTRGHQGLGAVLARPSPALRLYDQLEPSPGAGGLLREIDRPDRGLPGTGPSRLRRPHRAGTDAVAGQGLPGTLFPRS